MLTNTAKNLKPVLITIKSFMTGKNMSFSMHYQQREKSTEPSGYKSHQYSIQGRGVTVQHQSEHCWLPGLHHVFAKRNINSPYLRHDAARDR